MSSFAKTLTPETRENLNKYLQQILIEYPEPPRKVSTWEIYKIIKKDKNLFKEMLIWGIMAFVLGITQIPLLIFAPQQSEIMQFFFIFPGIIFFFILYFVISYPYNLAKGFKDGFKKGIIAKVTITRLDSDKVPYMGKWNFDHPTGQYEMSFNLDTPWLKLEQDSILIVLAHPTINVILWHIEVCEN